MGIVDSSFLIPLSKIGKLILLRKFFKEIKITQEIYEEINAGDIGKSEIERGIDDKWIIVRGVEKTKEVRKMSALERISEADASIIFLAEREREILLSNDYCLIMVARSKGVECWWPTTFILGCLKRNIINKKEAKRILFELIGAGMRLDNVVYVFILDEIERM